ncbi:DMT family transporter [Opitutus terrae]|uniref:EamA domain-containing protein n=1 Tax=Opitutus terrae (strain DSM 11246 / JCM 15787 / PB90-1) TaxID=452637 RepID=B1ZNX7_OPITP|nr:DMT family transporter [Opitutus terrae]ACB77466.1 protein of unknown function DUF6 transmembrane [Opitutus terrae PB90-1]
MLMLLSTVCFTANVLLIRALGEFATVNVWLISCTRFVVGLVMILALYRQEFQPRHLYQNRQLISRGLAGGIGVYAYYLTVIHIGPGRATFINNTYVIFGALLAVWMLGERFTAARATGSTMALGGLALLTNPFAAGAVTSIYDLLAIGGAFLSAYIVVTIRQLHASEHTSTIFAAQCVYGLLVCSVPAALHPEPIAPLAWAVMLGAGICAGAGQLAMTRAFRELPVAEGSLLQMIVPVGIALGGFALFGEHFTRHELLGAALILGGTTYTSLRR